MRHRGTLFATDNAEGIIAVFVLDEDQFSLEVAGEVWAGWHVSLISLAESGVNEYEFNLNGDVVRFVPDNRLDFAYGAVPGLAKAQEAASKGFRARRKTKKAAQGSTSRSGLTTTVASPATTSPVPAVAERPVKVKAPKVEKVKAKKVKAKKPAARKPAAAKVPAPAATSVTAAATPRPVDGVPRVKKVMPETTAAADPFSEPTAMVGTPPPTAPNNGELVIDLRAPEEVTKPANVPAPVASATNGHHPTHAAKSDTKGGLRILERVRQSRAEHVHDYQVSSSGVMVRRVCSTCNHVSIGTSD